jgi:hypothetical protein
MSFLHPDASARLQQFDRLTAGHGTESEHRAATAEGAGVSAGRNDPKDRAVSPDPTRR